MIIHIPKLSFRYVLLSQAYVKLTLDFGARPFCIPKKTNKFRVCLRIESFSNFAFSLNPVEDPAQCGEPLNP